MTSRTGSVDPKASAKAASSTSIPLRGKPEETWRKVKTAAGDAPSRSSRNCSNAERSGAWPMTRTGTERPESTRALATNAEAASTPSKSRLSAAIVSAGTIVSSQKNNAAQTSPAIGGGVHGVMLADDHIPARSRVRARAASLAMPTREASGTRDKSSVGCPSTAISRTPPGRAPFQRLGQIAIDESEAVAAVRRGRRW